VLLELCGIDKRFGAVHANRSVDLVLERGEILGLLGENGAGKTTLMNILFGMYSADAGSILIDGRAVSIHRPADALAYGVGMVHQHFHLVPRHTVLENLMVGHPGRHGMLDRAGARARLADIGRQYGLRLDPAREVGQLSVGQQQRLEIAKALFRGAQILILDEPTAVLTPQETEGLFDALRAMQADGVGIIFISHKLHEVRTITTRIAVMRAGAMVATLANDDTATDHRLAELMCGHDLSRPVKRAVERGPVLLRLAGVSTAPSRGQRVTLQEVSLVVHGGEIVGLAGVSGNGQRELADVLAGILPHAGGRIEVGGQSVARPTPRRMRALGLAVIPEDRIGAGLMTTLPLADSMALPRIFQPPFSRLGMLRRRAIRAFVGEQMRKFSIAAASPEARTGTLSGGNLQKALLARELAFDPRIVIAAQPTRGLDVASRDFVHRELLAMRARGRAVLVISEDLEELFEITDRIVVMYEGRIVGAVATAQASPAHIGLLMTGGVRAEARAVGAG
jgi:ABC-type uncharacterized transport system ATPase subunit